MARTVSMAAAAGSKMVIGLAGDLFAQVVRKSTGQIGVVDVEPQNHMVTSSFSRLEIGFQFGLKVGSVLRPDRGHWQVQELHLVRELVGGGRPSVRGQKTFQWVVPSAL